MSISAIGSLGSLYSTQNLSGITGVGNTDGAVSALSGATGRYQHAGGKFLQDVTQAMQSLGLNISALNSGSASASSAADGASSQSLPSAAGKAQQDLHSFLHDLFQALHQNGSQAQASVNNAANSGNGDQQNSSVSTKAALNAYNQFGGGLQNLISALNNGGAVNGAVAGGTVGALQTDFANLVDSMGSSKSSSPANLKSFLQQLQGYAQNTSSQPNAVGSILTVRA